MYYSLQEYDHFFFVVGCKSDTYSKFLRNVISVTDYIEKEIEKFGRTSLYFYNDHKEPVYTKLSLPSEELLKSNENLNKVITFRLYTSEMKITYEELIIDDDITYINSHFCSECPTRFITHGYMSSADGPPCTLIRDGEN